jgi:hypothetical protein
LKGIFFHGTDIDNLDSILRNGLRKGSALDDNKSWVIGYPVVLKVEALQGEYVHHNKYYKSGNVGKILEIDIKLDEYVNSIETKIVKILNNNVEKILSNNIAINVIKNGLHTGNETPSTRRKR